MQNRLTLLTAVVATVLALAGLAAQAQKPPVSRAAVEAAMKKAECDVPIESAVSDGQPADLGNGLVLVEVYCWRAAYNFGSIFFAVDSSDPNKARLLAFQILGEGGRLVPTYAIVGSDFDPQTRTMRTFFKGRGVGDCGDIGEWRWTGNDFAPQAYWRKGKCDGEPFDSEGSGHPDEKWRVFPPRN